MRKGLGTQLRHLVELLDNSVAKSYENLGLNYRPRYTPVMKALVELKQATINELASFAGITQPAATQTIKLMASANLISMKKDDNDSRKKLILLSDYGHTILPTLQRCWIATKKAEDSLFEDLGFSLSDAINLVTEELQRQPFDRRIAACNKDPLISNK